MARTAKKTISEDVWRSIRELREAQKETDRQLKESALELKRRVDETSRVVDQTSRSIDKANGNFNNKWGQFLENLVQGDLVPLLNQRGVKVDKIRPRVKYLRADCSVGAEYDLVADNGFEAVVFEVKTTLYSKDLHIFMEKLMRFKEHFSEYSSKKIYGGIAYMSAEGDCAEQAVKQGLFVIKAPGGAKGVSTLCNPQDFIPKSF